MSTSTTHQQSLADAGYETRLLMLERGPYVFKNYTPLDSQTPRLQTEDVLRGDDLKHYEAEIEAIVQADRVNIQNKFFGNNGRNTRCSYVQEEIIKGKNVHNDAWNTQRTLRTTSSGSAVNMLLAKQDEAGLTLTNEQNDFLVVDATRMEEIEELRANICLMARIQPANIDSNEGTSYDSVICISHVEYDNNVQASYELEQLARKAYKEAEKQQINANKVKQQNKVLTQQLELYTEKHVNQNTYAYAEVRVENQDLLMTISELKTKLKNIEKGLKAAPSVRRPLDRDSPFKNSVLSNTKKSSEKVEVSARTNKKTYVASKNVVSNKKILTDVDVKNALKAKDVLSVSCAKNVLIPCHDKYLVKYKLNEHSKVRKALFTTPIIAKSTFEDTTLVVSKTRFSVKTTQSKSLDTTPVVSKTKIAAVTPLSAKNKVVQIVLCIVDSGYLKHMTGDCTLLENFIKKFIGTLNYNAKIHKIRTDNGTEFKNANLKAHYEKLGIMQQFLIARTPQQNGVVEICNRTLVEATRTMLIFFLLPKFLLVEVISNASFTQNRSIIHPRYNKTPYELLYDRKPNLEYFHVFGSLCYPTNDQDDLGKMKPKADIGTFIGYSKTSRGFQIYNQRTKKIMDTIHVKFDKLTAIASEHDRLEPVSQRFINDDSSVESMNTPSKEDLDNLFGPMYEEYFEKRSSEVSINSAAQQVHNNEDSSLTSSIIVEVQEAPPIVTTSEEQTSPILMNEADELNQEDSAKFDGNTLLTLYNALNFAKVESSTTALDPLNMHEKRISHKRTKNKAKNNKTEHGMEKCEKTKPNRSQKVNQVKKSTEKSNSQSQVNSEKLNQKRI
ncbi:retrovirus-related pol polyprotein from transposon TNT 1-94 [Tanacetum coccineum]